MTEVYVDDAKFKSPDTIWKWHPLLCILPHDIVEQLVSRWRWTSRRYKGLRQFGRTCRGLLPDKHVIQAKDRHRGKLISFVPCERLSADFVTIDHELVSIGRSLQLPYPTAHMDPDSRRKAGLESASWL